MALYRKYRPASFAEVVGQEQVTVPLSKALDGQRINHAYLFSGPRGCGKTSSARILARSLNCVYGPTSTPCGTCDSCVALAPGGPGNLDVMEIDAASHNGVDDMRELRERAIYAPAESRYRVFIIDEAHMITTAGSNALLKIVEEPPQHLVFIFATTEPEKVIGTIRSRTHHYPFRLLAPPDMRSLIERIVADENVSVDPAVYPLVIQAGGGSPRDTLSILDQLLAGAGPDGLSYEEALPLLGVTDLSLLDDAVNALSAGDAAALFSVVGRVIDSGSEPRRFAEDLLDRLRDLMILQTVNSAFDQGLVDAPTDRADVLREQAQSFQGDKLARLASTVNEALGDMRGATSQRLLLEIACARMLVEAGPAIAPAAGSSRDAAAAAALAAAGAAKKPEPTRADQTAVVTSKQEAPLTSQRREASKPAPSQTPPQTPAQRNSQQPQQSQPESPKTAPQESRPAPAEAPAQNADSLLATIRSSWADIRQEVAQKNHIAGIMLTEARVLGMRDNELVLGHNTGALAQRINAASNNTSIVEVFKERFQRDLVVKCVVGTKPEEAGFSAPQEKPVAWNPHQSHGRQAHTDTQESPGTGGESDDDGPRAESSPTQKDPWGTPTKIPGSENEAPVQPEPVAPPAPSTPPAAKQEARHEPTRSAPAADNNQGMSTWEALARKAAQQAADRAQRQTEQSFSNGTPLPPEPDFGESVPPEDPGYTPTPPAAPAPLTRDEEEKMMVEQAQEPGSSDRRDATQVAVDLLISELGARRA